MGSRGNVEVHFGPRLKTESSKVGSGEVGVL